ncbi:MAG: hypothetical protein JXR61_14280 [Prolixibacteraceae bacterium]|nr:hypothetical protein [Prolixibacteraceae bacterium]
MKKLYFIVIALAVVLFSCKEDPVPDEPIILDNLDDLEISSMVIDGDNTLWIATDDGLYKKVTDGYLEIELNSDITVTALAYESNINTLWAGTAAGIYKIKLGETETTGELISADKLSNTHILDVYIDSESARWFGTKTGITRSKGDTWQKEKFKKNQNSIADLGFSDHAITSIAAWEGHYFFATAGYKLWWTSGWDDSVDAFTSASYWDPPYNGVAITDTMYAVFIDSRDFQWFGGQEGIQVHIGDDPKTNNYAFKTELVNEHVHCIAEAPNGEIWCGTENGISIGSVSESGVVWNPSTANLTNNFITSIVFQGNTAWIGTKEGLNEITL